jgi:signal transduction histidine kinase
MQILALLVGGLVIAQAVTVLVVVLLPPEPPQVYRLSEIAAALEGASLESHDGRPLSRSLHDEPPAYIGQMDRLDQRSRKALADLLRVKEDQVRLELHRPPPLAGASTRLFGPQGRAPRDGGRPGVPFAQPPDDGQDPSEPLVGRPFPPFRAAGGFGPGRIAFDHPLIGSFTAALRQPSGQWVQVEPTASPFLNEWQRRVLFWFVACMVVLAVPAWLFARRITAPIRAFAEAAERIGRDPTSPLVELSGPAEIGVAARAMNDMQVRLKRYVQDRTASIAAVSHDLRTPLARMRFKLEKAPPELKASLAHDVDQMEQMVCAVLEFIREGAEPRRRERIDLLSALECVVDDATAAGASVELTRGEPIIVDADALGLERLFANLVDNASKYGHSARVSVAMDGEEGVVEIADQGPGLPDAELERVFQPFYRVEPSRSRETGGIGLGLAVARSIARAHGGEVSLSRGECGLVARVRLPRARA